MCTASLPDLTRTFTGGSMTESRIMWVTRIIGQSHMNDLNETVIEAKQ